MYSGTQSAVRVDGELTDWFGVNAGLRQGCLLSPALFNIYMDNVMKVLLKDIELQDHGISIDYRMSEGRKCRGNLVEGIVHILDLLYADDLVLVCNNENSLKDFVSRFDQVTKNAGLEISVKKTKILISDSGEPKPSTQSNLTLCRGDTEEAVETVKEFVYLGSLLTESGGNTKEITRRINLGTFKFNQLLKPLWNQPCVSLKTKLSIYKSVVMNTVLYGCEAWTCTDADYALLNVFHTKKLRQLANLKMDQISNDKLYKLTDSYPLENVVRKYRLRWAGHVARLENTRIPKMVLFGRIERGGTRPPGRPKSNWFNCLSSDCEMVNIPYGQWHTKAKDRDKWRDTISSLTSTKKK